MNIQKIVTGGGDDGSEADEDKVQSVSDCNENVASLFANKNSLTSVTLTFANGGTKTYNKVDESDDEDGDDTEG